jgi:hypothetical protein
MTLRLHIGIDPGQSGAIAALADGAFVGCWDMPTLTRKAGGELVNANALAAELRGLLPLHSGAAVQVALEQVGAMPGQGVSSMFRFGQADGIVRGVVGALGLALVEVAPVTWKRRFCLTGQDKDAARTLAVQRFPEAAAQLTRKRDVGRADALLIAEWAFQESNR